MSGMIMLGAAQIESAAWAAWLKIVPLCLLLVIVTTLIIAAVIWISRPFTFVEEVPEDDMDGNDR